VPGGTAQGLDPGDARSYIFNIYHMPARKKPKKIKPTEPEKDVVEIQDPQHSEKDFLRDLEKASKKKPDDPSRHDQVSRRT
jgi:hypothetical protein